MSKTKVVHIESDNLIAVTTRKVFESLEICINDELKGDGGREAITE
jgi:hypothetical protein